MKRGGTVADQAIGALGASHGAREARGTIEAGRAVVEVHVGVVVVHTLQGHDADETSVRAEASGGCHHHEANWLAGASHLG